MELEYCRSCGKPLPANAPFCPFCVENPPSGPEALDESEIGAWRHLDMSPAQNAAEDHEYAWGDNAVEPVNAPRANALEGEVRGFQTRTEQRQKRDQKIIWTFRLERYDGAGNQLQPIPVEMRAKSYEGFISEGDQIAILHGRWEHGRIIKAKKLYDSTTDSVVKAREPPILLKILLVIVALCALALIALLAYNLAHVMFFGQVLRTIVGLITPFAGVLHL